MDAVSKYKPKKDNEIKLKCYLNKENNGVRKDIRNNVLGICK
jgi:hypothetical protein